MSGIKVVFGAAVFQAGRDWPMKEAFQVLKDNRVDTLDTAQIYGDSERLLGEASAGDDFVIDTKAAGGFFPGSGTKENIINTAKEALEKLNVKKVHVFYLHAPDPSVPLESTLEGVNEVYKSGAFSRFGLSNYKAEDVQKVYDYNKEHGYVLPTVYQGNYSAVARLQESVLLPTLRKLGISFYAYSPIAGGFLTKTKQQVLDGAGRFDPNTPIGKIYSDMYSKPEYLEVLARWEAIAKEENCSRADLAYRWVTYNSALKKEHGDAIIIGARNFDQLKQTLAGLKDGPLSAHAVKEIDGVWDTIKEVAPLDNYYK
ncbi:hypothetical protein MBLNU459_g7649t1 [Dothideomycetes sp. NU459]